MGFVGQAVLEEALAKPKTKSRAEYAKDAKTQNYRDTENTEVGDRG